MKSKSYVFMFITSLFVFISSLSAATIDSNAHKQTVTNYIEEINQIQKQIFTLTQKIVFIYLKFLLFYDVLTYFF